MIHFRWLNLIWKKSNLMCKRLIINLNWKYDVKAIWWWHISKNYNRFQLFRMKRHFFYMAQWTHIANRLNRETKLYISCTKTVAVYFIETIKTLLEMCRQLSQFSFESLIFGCIVFSAVLRSRHALAFFTQLVHFVMDAFECFFNIISVLWSNSSFPVLDIVFAILEIIGPTLAIVSAYDAKNISFFVRCRCSRFESILLS